MVTPMALAVAPAAFRTEPMVAGGSFYTAALRNDGTVWAWGDNQFGQLGDGTGWGSATPVQVQDLRNVVAISAGGEHIAALRNDGTVWTWGRNYAGRLGDGTTTNRYAPVQVQGLTNVIAVSAGAFHTVALRSDGTVWAWGRNAHGQLGDGTGGEGETYSTVPVQVQNLTNVTAISAGGWHTAALRNDGTAWTWGLNQSGELGDGTTTRRNTPVQVQNLTNVIAISADGSHTVALRSDGTVWTWGSNQHGQLGDDTVTERHTPVQVQSLTNVIAISSGWYTVALRSDGTVWSWGGNDHGQLGDGTTTNRHTPVQVQNLTNVTVISAGAVHVVALRGDGSVWAWGLNSNGQLGDGTVTNRHTPVRALGPDGAGFLNLGVGARFTDVPLNAWFHDAVEFVYDQGIMSGTSPTTFAPNANFSREMVVATLFRLHHGRPANSADSGNTPFLDVGTNRWYAPYVAWGYREGIVTGTSPTVFGTGNPVSRQDFAVLLHRFANFAGADIDVPEGFALDFPDANVVGSWAEDALTWAVYEGLITGIGQLLVPAGTATRAQAATILMRYV